MCVRYKNLLRYTYSTHTHIGALTHATACAAVSHTPSHSLACARFLIRRSDGYCADTQRYKIQNAARRWLNEAKELGASSPQVAASTVATTCTSFHSISVSKWVSKYVTNWVYFYLCIFMYNIYFLLYIFIHISIYIYVCIHLAVNHSMHLNMFFYVYTSIYFSIDLIIRLNISI